jgi:uncharacterized RDD family membrane protein YckC
MSMPQGGESGQSWEAGSGPGPAGTPPGQPYGQPQYGQPQGGEAQYGQPQYGQPPPAYGGGATAGRPTSPVSEAETRVTGKRTVQYIVDVILSGIVFSILNFFLSGGHGVVGVILTIVLVLADIAWYFAYWAYIPYARNGQTFGMSLLKVRVISEDGGPASLGQMFGRSILLVLTPWSLLVGFITMMFSRYRQRVGDHLAHTLVVRAGVEPRPVPQEYVGAGQAGTR